MIRSTRVALAFTLAGSLAASTGCDMAEPAEAVSVDLRSALGTDSISVVGVSVEPDTGRRLIVDQSRGIFALTDAGSEPVIDWTQLPSSEFVPQSAFTDMVAMGEGRYALTARNEGYLLDMAAGTFERYFCYVPDGPGGVPDGSEQLTNSVSYDPVAGMLYAQPQTFFDGELVGASVGQFDETTGADVFWNILDTPEFLAGGLAAEGDGSLLLGHETALYRTVADTSWGLIAHEKIADLADMGVTGIDGLTIDRATGSLLVIDRSEGVLFEMALVDLPVTGE